MHFRYTSDMSLAKNAAAFTIVSDGIPIIYAGQEQHYSGGSDPANREAVWLSGYNTDSELYKLITKANAVRSQAISQSTGYITYKVRNISIHPFQSRPRLYQCFHILLLFPSV